MKCSSTEYIQPYVASTAYQSAMTRQSPLRSASRLTCSHDSQKASSSARVNAGGKVLVIGLLDAQRHRRAVADGRLHLGAQRLVGMVLHQHDPVGRPVEAEDVGRLL